MNVGELIQKFRYAIQDTVEDYLYPTLEVIGFANEAVVEACRRSHLLVSTDPLSPISAITLVPGTTIYPISPKILQIRSYRLVTSTKTKVLPVKDYRELDECYGDWQSRSGEVECIVHGLNTNKITVYRKPTVADKIVMTVVHLPATEMLFDADLIPIPEHFQNKLVHWLLYKAYSKNDSEAKNEKLAALNLALFEQEFGTLEVASAQYEQFRKISADSNFGVY